jgi:hypothetical protein
MKNDIIIEPGMKVTYKTEFAEEKGILKSLSGNEHAFVVYNCNGDWDSYENYTAERTRICDLEEGW